MGLFIILPTWRISDGWCPLCLSEPETRDSTPHTLDTTELERLECPTSCNARPISITAVLYAPTMGVDHGPQYRARPGT